MILGMAVSRPRAKAPAHSPGVRPSPTSRTSPFGGSPPCDEGGLRYAPPAHCNSGGERPFEPLSQTPPSPSNSAPRARPTTSPAGRLKSLKHVSLHINLANPVHRPSPPPTKHLFWTHVNGGKYCPALRACFPDPPPPIHTGSKPPPPPPPELQFTAGLSPCAPCTVCEGIPHPPGGYRCSTGHGPSAGGSAGGGGGGFQCCCPTAPALESSRPNGGPGPLQRNYGRMPLPLRAPHLSSSVTGFQCIVNQRGRGCGSGREARLLQLRLGLALKQVVSTGGGDLIKKQPNANQRQCTPQSGISASLFAMPNPVDPPGTHCV